MMERAGTFHLDLPFATNELSNVHTSPTWRNEINHCAQFSEMHWIASSDGATWASKTLWIFNHEMGWCIGELSLHIVNVTFDAIKISWMLRSGFTFKPPINVVAMQFWNRPEKAHCFQFTCLLPFACDFWHHTSITRQHENQRNHGNQPGSSHKT